MQSPEEDNLLHSCFGSLKTAVMGCCYSICNKENDTQDNTTNERTHLLESSEQHHEAATPAMSSSTPPRKPDEQTALNKILHDAANNVIDVSALGPYSLESSAYNERVRVYTARLVGAGGGGAAAARLLADVPAHERRALLHQPPLPNTDREFLTNSVKKAAAAISELRVEHHEDLVVPFRVP